MAIKERYSVYATYLLKTNKESGFDLGNGYSDTIHCNYLNRIDLQEVGTSELNLYFNNQDVFKFLSISGGTGYTANEVHLLVQIVDNEYDESNDYYIITPPTSNQWRIFNATHQINDHISGSTITPENISNSVFSFPFILYETLPIYDLSYLNYPSEANELCFGDEEFFYGNVLSDREAIIHSTEIPIELLPSEFNTSTNLSWKEGDDVYITEVGIYDSENNLVAIGKLNDPIKKNDKITRTIIFGIDF
jgi:hypothetical protein